VEIAGVVADGTRTVQTLIVDGKLVQPVALSSSTGAGGGWLAGAVRIDFGARILRDIWIETGLFVAYLKVGASDVVDTIDDSAEIQLTATGDSYLQTNSDCFGNGGAIALEIAARLGIRRVARDAIGGTGFWNSGGSLGNLNDRLAAITADASNLVLVMSGLNDYGDNDAGAGLVWPATATYENAVLGYFAALRTAQPKALIVATAPFCPVPPLSDSTYKANPAVNVSAEGDFLYKAALHKRALQAIDGPWVYVDVLMGGGWLNSSGASGDVTGLQWFTGGTAVAGTTATNKPGNALGGGGGGFGGVGAISVVAGGRYSQAPEVIATGGSGSGLLLSSTLGPDGALKSIQVISPGSGYTSGALPTVVLDPTFELAPATLGMPSLIAGVNPLGEYPLQSFAPAGATDLNNIYRYLSADTVHPSPPGAHYLSRRLAQNIYDAVMAL
jgi:lysophospholipase L1-like esterase